MTEIWSKLILNAKWPRVVTIIGGGGKTSLMYYLLTLLKNLDCSVIAATTTKLSSQYRSGHSFVEIKTIADGYQAIEKVRGVPELATLIYGPDSHGSGKMLGISGDRIDQLAARGRDIVIVVEGDGSAGKSLKGHLDSEPVIPKASSIVIVVIGIDSVGVKLTCQHVHRPERVSELIGSIPESLITTAMITQLLFHPQGYLHNCPKQSEIVFFINKVESINEQTEAEKLAIQILAYQHPQVCGVIIGSVLKAEGRWLQA